MQTHDHSTTAARPLSSIALRPYNQKELAVLYGISSKTLQKWLAPFAKKIGKRRGYYYNILQVRKIFSLLGFPGVMYEGE